MTNEQQRPASESEKTPLYIGPGVQFAGTIRHAGAQSERAVILGEFTGDIEWNGVLHVPQGGKLVVDKALRCREILVSGAIVGSTEDALIETGLLRLGKTATIEVGAVSVPPGGLEQQRGSVVNAKLRMTTDNAYAGENEPTQEATPSSPSLTLVASSSQPVTGAAAPSDEPPSGGVPRFLTAGA